MSEAKRIKIEDEESAASQTSETGQEEAAAAEPDPQEEIASLKDQVLRLHAEFDNYRKRTERETASFKRYAQESLVKELLPHLDNLERAVEHGLESNPEDPLLAGVELTLKGLIETLGSFGVTQIEALGQPFDPDRHEAVMQQEDAEAEDKTVLGVTQNGYLLHDRLLRPAMVIVSKRPADDNENQGD